MKPATRLFFGLLVVSSLTFAYGCGILGGDSGPTKAVSSAEEEKIASGRYNDELAIGPTVDKSLRIKIETANIYDEIHSVKALDGEKLLVLRLSVSNKDEKLHKVPIAGFTFAGEGFNVPSASAIDQDKVPSAERFTGGEIEPGGTMTGNLLTRIPANRMSKPFLIGIWVDEKKQIWTELCARNDDIAQATRDGVEPLPKCKDNVNTGHQLIHVKI